jgi:hypothetical protein
MKGKKLSPAREELAQNKAVTIQELWGTNANGRHLARRSQIWIAELARSLQQRARRATSPYLLVWEGGTLPPGEWIGTAEDLFITQPDLACITAGGGAVRPEPAVNLNPSRMIVRRDVLLESGGLLAQYRGVGDGVDLAWRLWAMGYRVVDLSTGKAPLASTGCDSIYLLHRNWLWTLIRNCDEETWSVILSRRLLQMMAWTGKLVQGADVVFPAQPPALASHSYIEEMHYLVDRAADLAGPIYQAGWEVGEMLTVFHDMMLWLPLALKERQVVQALRRYSDRAISQLLGMDLVQAVEQHFTALRCQFLKHGGRTEGGDKCGS